MACIISSMDYSVRLAEQLRPQLQALRRKRGITQAQLGAAIGVTQARIVEIEANPGLVSLQQMMRVIHALGAGLVIRDTAGQGVGAAAPTPGKDSW
jgi:HTH-type transcriptional regulator/antitoxin HipB